jgi:pyruvate dehydrogenase E2 component (dihydrolipoamide acetyltransferase)
MRRAIAQRMMQSLSSKAQMTGFGRVDMAEAMCMRESLVAAQAELGARITYTDLVLKAAATVLSGMPQMNAYIDGDEIVDCHEIHIGLAVALEGGLIVPVLRHVDRLSLVELSLARQTLIDKARAGKLAREDVEGGSFTLSNFGSYGGDFETPILNAPQSALLGIGQIVDEAVVRDKQIVIRPMMSISLTFDHALIDGAVAGEFRARFKALLETPALLLARLR